jgi:hypothetical protein
MDLLGIFKNIVKPITKVIDDVHTSAEEKLELKNQLATIMVKANLDAERIVTERIKEQASVIKAEINSASYLARNWRPMLMCLFGIIIANNYIVAPYMASLTGASVSLPIPPEMWALLKLGVSGYIVGRSVEKGIEKWKQ